MCANMGTAPPMPVCHGGWQPLCFLIISCDHGQLISCAIQWGPVLGQVKGPVDTVHPPHALWSTAPQGMPHAAHMHTVMCIHCIRRQVTRPHSTVLCCGLT